MLFADLFYLSWFSKYPIWQNRHFLENLTLGDLNFDLGKISRLSRVGLLKLLPPHTHETEPLEARQDKITLLIMFMQ